MKSLLNFIAIMLPITSVFAQDIGNIGVGLGFNSTKGYEEANRSMLTVNTDYLWGKNLIGLDIGFGKSINENQDYTGTISQYNYLEDIQNTIYSQTLLGVRIGRSVIENFFVIGTIGANFFNEYQERFDELYILGYDGVYFVRTDKEITRAYLELSIGYKIDNLMLDVGIANSGVGFSLTWFF